MARFKECGMDESMGIKEVEDTRADREISKERQFDRRTK